jgi:hypothetical protein
MNETTQGFIQFLRSMDLHIYQERDVGLDIYLSGPWGVLPLALAVASATVFALAILQIIPRVRHSIALLLAAGLLAAGIGLGGTYLQYRAQRAPGAPPPPIIAQGKGGTPETKPGQTEALLALPLLLGGLTLAVDIAGTLFIVLAGGKGASAPQEKKKA